MSVVLSRREGAVATLTLNRPEVLNAIDDALPRALRDAVEAANADPAVKVIVLEGKGDAFCAGYDLQRYAERPRPTEGSQDMPWDPLVDYAFMAENTRCFMSLWRGLKPTVAKVHGYAVAGGSDIALCCDLVVMAEDSLCICSWLLGTLVMRATRAATWASRSAAGTASLTRPIAAASVPVSRSPVSRIRLARSAPRRWTHIAVVGQPQTRAGG